MQSWCPESFGPEADTAVAAAADGAQFAGETPAVPAGDGESAGEDRRFRREAGFTDSNTILQHMSQQERAVVFELVEIDVAARYEEREQALRAELEAAREAELAALRDATTRWSEEFSAHRDEELRELAAASARLAVQLAERIVRAHVGDAPEVLVRAIEAALRSAGGPGDLTVTAAPAEAAWLEGQADLRARLSIARVVADRRVESGGCLIAAGDREWDASLQGQLSTLGEVVDDWLATSATAHPSEEEAIEPAVE